MTSTPLVLLLAMALLSAGCASLTPPPGQRMNLRCTPHEASPLALDSPLLTSHEPEAPARPHQRRDSREAVTAGAGSAES